MTALPEAAYGAALAAVGPIGSAGLRGLLAVASPSEAWAMVCSGRSPGRATWREAATGIDVAELWERHRGHGIDVLLPSALPSQLRDDPDGPGVLFARGDSSILGAGPQVAIVGTRSATRYGLGVAAELGAQLVGAGVSVISGLALGIDGAAHEGAYGAYREGPGKGALIGVVAGGLDRPYPSRHARLWERVVECGVLVSELPVGAPVPSWRFAHRNRIMAALADVVVVVECHQLGGSLHTVRAAEARGVPVGAVPGSIRSPASAGTNDLLADGCFVVRDAADVMVALGLARAGLAQAGLAHTVAPAVPDPLEAAVLTVLDHDSCSFDTVVRETGLALAEVSTALARLVGRGLVCGDAGWWSRV